MTKFVAMKMLEQSIPSEWPNDLLMQEKLSLVEMQSLMLEQLWMADLYRGLLALNVP